LVLSCPEPRHREAGGQDREFSPGDPQEGSGQEQVLLEGPLRRPSYVRYASKTEDFDMLDQTRERALRGIVDDKLPTHPRPERFFP
jgi:hypothetical protein